MSDHIKIVLATALALLHCLATTKLSPAQPPPSEISLALGPYRDMAIEKLADSVLSITLQAGHPHFWTAVVPKTYSPNQQTVLAFEYFAPSGLQSVVLRYRVADGTMAVAGSAVAGVAETWQPIVFDLSRLEAPPANHHPEMRFHFVLNGVDGANIQIRNIRLRVPSHQEQRIAVEGDNFRMHRQREADAIVGDMRSAYSSSIESVKIESKTIMLTGKIGQATRLIAIAPHHRSYAAPRDQTDWVFDNQSQSNFQIAVPRFKGPVDRATWRWRLADDDSQWHSPASWATEYDDTVARKLPRLTASSVKGIAGVPQIETDDHPIFELGVHHATVNVVLNSLIRDAPANGWEPWEFEGDTFFINSRQLANHDTTLRQLAKKDIVVSAILLVGNGRHADGKPHTAMTHPEAQVRGIYSIPNLTEEDSTRIYRAVLWLMAERWSREDGQHGRISNWIMHNEIDQAGTWTNMGDQPLARYLETYLRSARLMHHTARLFDPHSRVFVSLTHHWTKKSSGSGTYVVRDMLELLAEMASTEGDFPWGVAYHPYPLDLRNPDTWNDKGLTSDFDTPYITPKNIAVLPAFLDQPAFHYQGKLRGILLSEQGFNSPTLSDRDQSRQAAGLIYMFRQLRGLENIEAYHLHRYQDMPAAEGGLRLGLITETGDRKKAWDVYKAIGTENESEYSEMADRIIGSDGTK